MTVAEQTVLTQTLELLPHLQVFGRIPDCFDIAALDFWISGCKQKIIYTC